jgi:hypothetical protein
MKPGQEKHIFGIAIAIVGLYVVNKLIDKKIQTKPCTV